MGLPEYTLTYSVRTAEDGSIIIDGKVEQRILLKPKLATKKEVMEGRYFTGIIPITVVGKSGKVYRKRLVIQEPSKGFQMKLPEKPKEIIFNKNGESLAYDIVVVAAK